MASCEDRNKTRWRVECCDKFLYEGTNEEHARLLYAGMASNEGHSPTLAKEIPAWTIVEAK